jgi:hypothetical protein
MNRQTAGLNGGGTGKTPSQLLRASGKSRCRRGMTGAGVAHVHAFEGNSFTAVFPSVAKINQFSFPPLTLRLIGSPFFPYQIPH